MSHHGKVTSIGSPGGITRILPHIRECEIRLMAREVVNYDIRICAASQPLSIRGNGWHFVARQYDGLELATIQSYIIERSSVSQPNDYMGSVTIERAEIGYQIIDPISVGLLLQSLDARNFLHSW